MEWPQPHQARAESEAKWYITICDNVYTLMTTMQLWPEIKCVLQSYCVGKQSVYQRQKIVQTITRENFMHFSFVEHCQWTLLVANNMHRRNNEYYIIWHDSHQILINPSPVLCITWLIHKIYLNSIYASYLRFAPNCFSTTRVI